MSLRTQILAATAFNLRSIPQRLGNSLVIVIGTAGVVAVLVSVLAMSSGFRRAIDADARADRAIVLSRSAESEASSSLSLENVALIQSASGIRKDAQGRPIASAEVVLVTPVSRKHNGADANVTLRGVGERYFRLRPEVRLIEGRMFASGVNEIIVGDLARKQFAGLELGDLVRLQDGDWTIVGVFTTPDSSRGSEVIADAQTVMAAHKLDAFNSMTVQLVTAGSIGMLRDALDLHPSLMIDVRSEPEYLASVSQSINRVLQTVAYAIGGIMAIGAIFAALNTMYAAIATRAVELATLRAIGFGSTPVLISLLLEALALALAGACIGIALAYLSFNGRAVSTLGGAVWDTQVVYSLTVTPSSVLIAVALACGIGVLGGLLPALRAVRAPVAEALRADA